MTCAACKFFEPQKTPGGRTRKQPGRCLVVVDQPALPNCVLKHIGFRWPPGRSYMMPDDGEDCVLQEPIAP